MSTKYNHKKIVGCHTLAKVAKSFIVFMCRDFIRYATREMPMNLRKIIMTYKNLYDCT